MNVGRVISRGIEAQVETRLRGGKTGYAGICALKAWNNTTGVALDNAPRLTANAGISLPVLSHKFYLSAEAQAVGSRTAENLGGLRGPVPSYITANLVLSGARALRNMDVSLGVYNLFNRTYYDPISTDVPPLTVLRVPQAGRTMRLQLNYKF